jgi:hypothetical protein
MNTLLKYLKVFAILIASFFIFSVLSCLIPTQCIKRNIEKSLPELHEDGNYPKTIFKGDMYKQDNFTDAIILNAIASSDSKRAVWSAMAIPLSFQAPDTEDWWVMEHLDYKIKHLDSLPNGSYSRYWFGSASVGKILLLVMNYQQIKWGLYLVSTLLLLLFAVKIVHRAGWIKSMPIFLALLFANFFVTQFSIQFFPVMAIALIGGIGMCKNGLKPLNKAAMCVFVTGIFTAYFDLLTTPLLTLGLPLIVYLILQSEEEKTIKELFKSLFVLCITWLIGYASAWAIKWVLAYILTDSTTIYAIEAIKWRTTTDGYTRLEAIARNFNLIPLVWLNSILTCLLLLTLFRFNKKGIKWAIAFLIVGLFPYMWYFVLSNHSHLHWWFTYRLQILSMACVMSAFVSLIDWERVNLKLKKTIKFG